ncbi:MAG: DUF2703 domain-containing protein [Planctomycetes bacterium]|nr:DUF2703 domain-containing protein [Planctomycetota bacterium]
MLRPLLAVASVTVIAVGCGPPGARHWGGQGAPTLTIRWQRLVDERGQTCERCGSTEAELQMALHRLRKSLGALGIRVVLEKKALSPEVFAKDAAASNRIWLGDRSLEDWLGATVGMSPCESCCAGVGQKVECRTISVGGQTYEGIPAGLIIRAGLLAASPLVPATSARTCCPATGPGR